MLAISEIAVNIPQNLQVLGWLIPILDYVRGYLNLNARKDYLKSRELPFSDENYDRLSELVTAYDHRLEVKGPTPTASQYVVLVKNPKTFQYERFVIDRTDFLPTMPFVADGEPFGDFVHDHTSGSSVGGIEVSF